ncbi:MAG: lyase family protein [Bacteroidales bacterium]|nr:lyase family protein [Bacteroidales bacterium]
MRREQDILGEIELPDDALYGIHAWRAKNNFGVNRSFPQEWYKAMGMVKLAYYELYIQYFDAVKKKYPEFVRNLRDPSKFHYLIEAAKEVSEGKWFDHFIVPAIQGGAGTSINMNINEIITNRALILLGHRAGEYHIIDPIEDANIFQSTNDVVPTALKIALMLLLEKLEKAINQLRTIGEEKEKQYRHVLRIGYTQLQEAIPSTWGLYFSTFNDALSRDWWRVSKVFERIKVVNAGGGAIGTGATIPTYFIMLLPSKLREISGVPLARGENLTDVTSNWDSLVEGHAILKSLAINLEKYANDLRFFASDFHGKEVLTIPARQVGSSIMPGKINPVIAEYVILISQVVQTNDVLIGQLASRGHADLNPFLPLMGSVAIESVNLLCDACQAFAQLLLKDLKIEEEISHHQVLHSPTIVTLLIPLLGYKKAGELAKIMKKEKINVIEANKKLNYIDEKRLLNLLSPSQIVKAGYRIKDILPDEER